MTPAEVLEAYGDAWARDDPEAAWSFYDDDVVMRVPGRGVLAGTHVGKEAVVDTIRALLARTSDSSVDLTVVDRLVSDDRVAMIVTERVTRGDTELTFRRVGVYQVRDGRIIDIDLFDANQYEVDEFFG